MGTKENRYLGVDGVPHAQAFNGMQPCVPLHHELIVASLCSFLCSFLCSSLQL